MRLFYQTFYNATREAVRDYDCFYAYPPELTPQVAGQCRDYITQAGTLARQPVVARRIESISKYWRVAELQIAAEQATAAWQKDKSQANRDAAKAAWTAAAWTAEHQAQCNWIRQHVPCPEVSK